MFLLDTVVLSELRKRDRNPGVVRWIESVDDQNLYLTTLTIGEIERGIALKQSDDPTFANALAGWLETTLRVYGDRILALDVAAARRWGRLTAEIGNKGIDLAIAAIALERGFTVVTRNVADFGPTGVPLHNPFSTRAQRRR